MRDIEDQIRKGEAVIKKHRNADLKLSEIDCIHDRIKQSAKENGGRIDLFKMINEVFLIGVAVGSRNYK